MTISRRSLLYSAAAAAGAGLLPRSVRLTDDARERTSGLATGKPKPLLYAELAGFLSKEQIRWHHDSHYVGALKGFKALDTDPTGSHRKRVAKANSVVLHELYFDNMTTKKSDPGGTTSSTIKARFGSLDRWIEDFRAAAKACRGWATLAYHPINAKLYNMSSDSHDDGPAWFGIPLVVVDMYEHAYYLDFQNRKADYAERFTDHINWVEIERRLRACQA